MYIQPVYHNASNISLKGLYWAKPGVLYNKSAQYLKQDGISVSETGVRYIEDKSIPERIKKAVRESKFIMKLAKEFDTFISYYAGESCLNRNTNVAFIKIGWADYSKKRAEEKIVFSESPLQEIEVVVESLIDKIKNDKFM